MISFNSRKEEYKKPFGAIEINGDVCLRFLYENAPESTEISLVLIGNNTQEKVKMNRNGNYFEVSFKCPSEPQILFYYFELVVDGNTAFYGNNEKKTGGKGQLYLSNPVSYQLTVYTNTKSPDWFKNAILYQIFCDRFCNGTGTNNVRENQVALNWDDKILLGSNEYTGETHNEHFGGDLYGVISKLDYLQGLGVNTIYFNPLFMANSNHKYDTTTYEEIDPLFGGNEAFDKLVEETKKRGMHIMLDGVFSHNGADSIYFDRYNKYGNGAYSNPDSPYRDWYTIHEDGRYECWWNIPSLPNVKEMTPSYIEYILTNKDSIVKRWLNRGASGWRLDVADELPDEFIRILRASCKEADNDAMVLGEVWEDASNKTSYNVLREYFLGKELDGVTNYPFKNAIIGFLQDQLSPKEVWSILESLRENYPPENFYACMNMLSGHDSVRFITGISHESQIKTQEEKLDFKLSEDVRKELEKKQLLAATFQFTYPGAPVIYYGDEIAMEGFGDPFNREPMKWDWKKDYFTNYYRKIGKIRNEHKVLRTGHFKVVEQDQLNVLTYLRYSDGLDVFNNPCEKETLYVIINRAVNTPFILKGIHGVELLTGEKVNEDYAVKPLSAAIIKMD